MKYEKWGRGSRQLKLVLSILASIHFYCTLDSDSFEFKSVDTQYQLKDRAKDDARQNSERSLKDTLKPTGADRAHHQYDERKTYEEVSIKGAWHTRSFKNGGKE